MMSQEACAVCGGRRDSQTTTSRTDDTAAKCVAIGAVVVCALAATMRCRQMRCARTQRRRLKGRRGGKVGRKSIRSGATSDKRTRSRSKNRPPLSVSIISPTPKCPTKSTRGNGGLKALSSAVVMRTRTVSGFALGSPSSAPTVLTAISVFNELATANAGGELKKMSEEAFAKALRDKLHLKLSPVEASRLFCNCDRCSNGSITLRPFLLAVRDNVFMRRVISSLRFPPKDTVPPGYDFSVPTYIAHRHEKYKGGSSWGTSTVSKYSPDVHGSLVGEFAHIRKTLDYSWHTNYSEKRQLWQDSLVNRVARRHRPVSDPWLVLTCGPMGAGKGYALRWMSKVGVFPLENVVQIDPDHFKAAMPEWDGYVRADPHCAGTLTHKESGFIQELAQTVSLKGYAVHCTPYHARAHCLLLQATRGCGTWRRARCSLREHLIDLFDELQAPKHLD